MSEHNIYKDHYELQAAFANQQQSLQNIYGSLVPFVAPHGVQITLQEVIDLVVQKLSVVTQAESDSAVAQEVEQVVSGETDVHASEPQAAEKTPRSKK